MKKAEIYRELRKDHICPFGVKAKYLLESQGFVVADHHLESKEEAAAFREKHGVKTTPQVFIDGQRVGGYDDLRQHFGKKKIRSQSELTYQPVAAIFGVAFLMAVAQFWPLWESSNLFQLLSNFVALAMCLLALQKLKNVEGFTNGFVTYDLIASRWIPAAYGYPYAELFVGLAMLGHFLVIPAGLISLFLGLVGAASVIKAVYIDKRSLKCSCVGGDSNVPLGFISLTENLMMIGMGLAASIRVLHA